MTTNDALEKGREAFFRRAWAAAYTELSTAARDGAGGPGDLERLAIAAYLIGQDAESADAWSRAYRAYVDEGDVNHAALCGFHLGMGFMNQGEMARASGWFARTQRLLDESGLDCVARGYLLVPDLTSYQRNQIAIDPLALPADVRIERTGLDIAPERRSGALAHFGMERYRGASVSFVDANGRALPPGATATTASGAAATVGYDGIAFFDKLDASNTVTIRGKNLDCTANVAYETPAAGTLAQLGPVPCIANRSDGR